MAGPELLATLVPPAVAALKEEAGGQESHRTRMERSVSEDFRVEKEDLREAAEHSQNVIVNLSLDGVIRFVTPSWQEVIGTTSESVIGKPIADIVVDNKNSFKDAIAELQRDDSRSQVIRFSVSMGPLSSYTRKLLRHKGAEEPEATSPESLPEEEPTLTLEAQGIMVYDRASGGETNTMWMIRPYVIREVTIDLPDILVESLGVGAEMLAQYLNELAEAGVNDPANHPPPLPVLCRICERQITPWWFEKHTELCLQEHTAEMDVQLAQESLQEHRAEIVKVLDALDAQTRQTRTSTSGELAPPVVSPPEYKGHLLGPASTPSSGPSSNPSSGRASPASPSRSRDRSSSSFGHNRARSFAIRRPVARIVELVLDLCDTALEINTPVLNQTRSQLDGEFRTQSPQSENRISQVIQWHSPSTVEQETGLAVLCDDTARLSRLKVDAVFRHRHILEYSERIRIEFAVLVQECIEAAMEKAARIAAGDISDSSTDTEGQDAELEAEDTSNDVSTDEHPVETGIFPGSFETQSAMTLALRNVSNHSLASAHERQPSSTATSTRSSSPRGSQTPRSHAGFSALPPPSKRNSIYFESDTGADSDSSIISSAMSVPKRTESPGSDLSLSRVHSSRDRKRRSLILPSVMSSRGHSPARGIQPPSSPLRMAKNRIHSGTESSQSPITSPVLTTSEFSSPSIMPQHMQQHHRRQSSAASSEAFRQPSSPRLAPVSSNPQPKAVPPSIKDFEIIKPISKGAFGSVYLSKKKSTGDYFAIKVLKKADMVAKNQITNVKAERAIMMWQGESDFVAKLYWTFSSKDYLYLVMEYLNGGDCASLIKVLGGLSEEWSKKYIAEVVLGVEHLHSRGIVHRDLKPDNLLIDQKGHLKLTDFGLSRMGLVGRQKRALNSKSDDPPVPDLLKQGPFHRAISVGSSRSASFDLHGSHSPSATPNLTAALPADIGQPSYFSLNRETSRKTSGPKTDSETSEGLHAMLRKFSLAPDDIANHQAQSPIEEETGRGETSPPEMYALQPVTSQISNVHSNTPPPTSGMLPPTMALFDPQDTTRKFVGTPDYLAPETINGVGQDEVSDWWSLGCILFEVLYGYPPFHAESPDQVFQNILDRKVDWPGDDVCQVSEDVKDVMNKLMCLDPMERLGANADEKFESGGDEIRHHPWFADINWETLRDDEASFVPAPENPEDTEYFDARGASLENFAAEFEDQGASPAGTPGADFHDRPHDALSRVRSQVNSIKRSLMPLHIPPHVRDGRTRRLSEPVAADDFGNFSFKNLPVLEKANKDVIQKLRAEAMQAQSKPGSVLQSPAVSSPSPSLESSPVLPMPLKRTISATKNSQRPSSPLMFGQPSASPNRISQPSSPLLVQFSAGQNHERRKASSGSSSLSHQGSASLQPPGNFFEAPRMMTSLKSTSSASSQIKLAKSPGSSFTSHERSMSAQRMSGNFKPTSPRQRSHTVSSQESEDIVKDLMPTSNHHKRRSQVVDVSPSSSDNEDSRQKAAFLRVQRRRQSSRRMSQITLDQGPMFRPLDVLICEDHPVSRLVMEKLLEKHRCRTISAQSGPEAMRYAMSGIKYDVIMMECKLPHINGADVARMIRDTKNTNTNTPIVCVTGYLKELPPNHHFDGLIDKPPTLSKLADMLGRLCQWKPPPSNWTPAQQYALMPLSSLRQESARTEDSPTSNGSSYSTNMPSGSYRGSSREDSISSSFFGDNTSQTDEVPVVISKHSSEDWHDRDLAQAFDGLGITEDLLQENEQKIVIPSLTHQVSAPGFLEHGLPRKKLSAERIGEKRRSIDKKRRDSADSGDDEDEELGNIQLRERSPKPGGRPRGTSKLGTEMMRTNSRGSVVSVDDISTTDVLPNSPPPMIAEDRPAEEALDSSPKHMSITPPELFPRLPGAAVQEIDMDADAATPKSTINDPSPDPDPTPRPSLSSVPLLEPEGSPSTKF